MYTCNWQFITPGLAVSEFGVNDSPPSSNCSRKYTVGSARTDVTVMAKKSSGKAVMATSCSNRLCRKKIKCLNKKNNCNMTTVVLMLAGPVYHTVTERRGWRATAVLGSDRCLNVIGRQLRLSTRKRCPVDQSKVKDSEELLLQPMGGDHAFGSCPPTDADKVLSGCKDAE